MARIAIRAVLTLATLLGVAGRAAADICLTVDYRFVGHEPTRLLVQSMQDEASSIWAPYGVYLEWPAGAADRSCDRADGSFDVVIQGQLSPLTLRTGAAVLGSTHIQLATVEHAAVHIDYDAIERTLRTLGVGRLTALAGHPGLESPEIGRALGRVLAHEIGHVLLCAPNHQPQGLMRPMFMPADLVALQRWSFTLSKGEVSRLRNRERVIGEHAANAAMQSDGLRTQK